MITNKKNNIVYKCVFLLFISVHDRRLSRNIFWAANMAQVRIKPCGYKNKATHYLVLISTNICWVNEWTSQMGSWSPGSLDYL